MSSDFQIRPCRKEDLPALIELCRAHAQYEGSTYPNNNQATRLAEHLLEEASAWQCLVVEQDHQLLGYASFIKQYATWQADYYLYLDCLYLQATCRGLGLGKALMQKVQAYAQREACFEIQWQTPRDNQQAIHFYQQLGATAKAKERFFWPLAP